MFMLDWTTFRGDQSRWRGCNVAIFVTEITPKLHPRSGRLHASNEAKLCTNIIVVNLTVFFLHFSMTQRTMFMYLASSTLMTSSST